MEIDVALVPAEARRWRRSVAIVVDELRASSTITTLLDLGCSDLWLTAAVRDARLLARRNGALLAGEHGGRVPRGFDFDNSPAALARAGLGGRPVVLCTSNGTAVLSRLSRAATIPAALVGCLLNARAVAEAALDLALSLEASVGVVCAGSVGRFVLDDAVAAGVIVERLVESLAGRGLETRLTDAARSTVRLRSVYPDVSDALAESKSGGMVHALGADDDIPFCARIDVSTTVPILRGGSPLRIERLERAGLAA